MKRLIESLQYKRDNKDWEDSFILRESNVVYGNHKPNPVTYKLKGRKARLEDSRKALL